MQNSAPIWAAAIAAIAAIFGYIYQKHIEREANARKYRQEVYARLIRSIRRREDIVEKLSTSAKWPSLGDPQFVSKTWDILQESPEAVEMLAENREVATTFSVYGTDDAIKAYVKYLAEMYEKMKNPSAPSPDMGKLIRALRKDEYRNTKITTKEVNMTIYFSDEFLEDNKGGMN